MSETENINCNSKRIEVENKEWIEMTDNSKRSECEAEVKSDYENVMSGSDDRIDMTDRESDNLTENERLMIALNRSKKVVNVLRCVECKAEFESALDVKRHLDVCVMSGDIQCLKTKSVYSRDSFDRFGDDLCEEMLSWLSFDDCFAYECVAKQWKRVVFNRRYRLNINPNKTIGQIKLRRNFEDCDVIIGKGNFILKLENITKKCLFIDEIYIENTDKISVNDYFHIILENCNQLKTFCFNREEGSCDVLRESWILFGEKFGQSLQKMSFLSVREDSIKPLLRLTSNLIECEIKDINDCLEESGEKLLPNLKVITAEINQNSNLEMFSAMYAKRVEKITVTFNVINNCFYQMKINRLFAQLSRFTKLKRLTINFDDDCKPFWTFISTEALNSIAINCRQLSRLALKCSKSCFLISPNIAQQFPNLKHLNLLHLYTYDLNLLRMCPNLVHLKLSIGPIHCNVFEVIEENVPQLKSLKFRIHDDKHNTDTSLQLLSRLKNLVSLRICSQEFLITANGLRQFLDIKPDIRILCIQCEANSSQDIIDAFIDLANRNPKRDYVLITDSTLKYPAIIVVFALRASSRDSTIDVERITLTKNLKYISRLETLLYT